MAVVKEHSLSSTQSSYQYQNTPYHPHSLHINIRTLPIIHTVFISISEHSLSSTHSSYQYQNTPYHPHSLHINIRTLPIIHTVFISISEHSLSSTQSSYQYQNFPRNLCQEYRCPLSENIRLQNIVINIATFLSLLCYHTIAMDRFRHVLPVWKHLLYCLK